MRSKMLSERFLGPRGGAVFEASDPPSSAVFLVAKESQEEEPLSPSSPSDPWRFQSENHFLAFRHIADQAAALLLDPTLDPGTGMTRLGRAIGESKIQSAGGGTPAMVDEEEGALLWLIADRCEVLVRQLQARRREKHLKRFFTDQGTESIQRIYLLLREWARCWVRQGRGVPPWFPDLCAKLHIEPSSAEALR